jgi:hypothetical protein
MILPHDANPGRIEFSETTTGALDRVAQIAERKYCRPQARPFRLGFPSENRRHGRRWQADGGYLRADHGSRPADAFEPCQAMTTLLLKRASASRPSGEWDDDDYDVLADGVVVGRIMETAAAPVGQPWMWTLAFGHHEDRTPTHGYAATREAAMAAFAKSWRRE